MSKLVAAPSPTWIGDASIRAYSLTIGTALGVPSVPAAYTVNLAPTHFATNSMKLLYYSQNCIRPTKNFFGSTERCVKAAISGRWE